MLGDSLTPDVSGPPDEDQTPARAAGVVEPPPATRSDPTDRAEVSSDYAIFWLDLTGRITRWTPECERLFGRSASEMSGVPFDALFLEEDRAIGKPQRALAEAREAGAWDGVGWQRTSGDDTMWAASSVTLVRTPNGVAIGHMVVVRDLTSVMSDGPTAPDATRLLSLGRVATDVSHELGNILAAIRGFASVLEGKLSPAGAAHQVWYEMVKTCDRGTRLTQQVLGIGAGDAVEPTEFCVADLVRELEPLLRQIVPTRIRLAISFDDEVPRVRAARGDIEMALMNLVVNARDAIRDEGAIDVEIGSERVVGAPSDEVAERVVLSVRDSGSGMTPSVRERLFERFFTTKARGEGTGIGMSLVRDAVEACGGSIEIESSPAAGTLVRLLLDPVSPAVRAASVRWSGAAGPHSGTSTEGKVIVCCGTSVLCGCAADLLQREGFDVARVDGPGEAIALLETTPAGVCDLAVVELVVDGTPGPAHAEALRARAAGLPVVFLVDREPESTEVLDTVVSCDRVLFAPFSPEELLETTRGCISGDEMRESPAIH